jgi:hypothetical protein
MVLTSPDKRATHLHRYLSIGVVKRSNLMTPLQACENQPQHEWHRTVQGHTHRLQDLESTIRKQDGSGRFLLAPTTADLIDQAKQDPIVVFNTTEIHNDALIVTEYD